MALAKVLSILTFLSRQDILSTFGERPRALVHIFEIFRILQSIQSDFYKLGTNYSWIRGVKLISHLRYIDLLELTETGLICSPIMTNCPYIVTSSSHERIVFWLDFSWVCSLNYTCHAVSIGLDDGMTLSRHLLCYYIEYNIITCNSPSRVVSFGESLKCGTLWFLAHYEEAHLPWDNCLCRSLTSQWMTFDLQSVWLNTAVSSICQTTARWYSWRLKCTTERLVGTVP